MNTPAPASKPWYKNWKILAPIVVVLAVIGLLSGMLDSDEQEVATAESAVSDEKSEKIPTWQRTESYKDYCTGEPSIDAELQSIVDAVEIPNDGHVIIANFSKDSSTPEMNTVFFALCSNAQGDELREIAETLAIEVKAGEYGDSISEMGVNASYANTSDEETIVRDSNFRARTHDGGESFKNGSYRAAWEFRD